LFDHGELRFVLLRLIEEKPRHGYEIIKAIEDRTGGSYSPSPGVIYPTLTMLEELGQAVVTEEAGKKRYALTDEGRAFLRDNRRVADAAMARMDEAAAAQGDGPAPPIVRAMENLRLALRLRLARGTLSETQVRGVAAALDSAATAIEQT
jgi:DNA-binding PadR family transcriptional regulator